MKKDKQNKEKHEKGHSGRKTVGDWLAGLIPAAVFAVLYGVFSGAEWLDWQRSTQGRLKIFYQRSGA